jgi:hypothetical protein
MEKAAVEEEESTHVPVSPLVFGVSHISLGGENMGRRLEGSYDTEEEDVTEEDATEEDATEEDETEEDI